MASPWAVTGRVSSRVRREAYVGPWLPEPVATDRVGDPLDLESISLAFLVVLETLSPLERAAFVLRGLALVPARVLQQVIREEAHWRVGQHLASTDIGDQEQGLLTRARPLGLRLPHRVDERSQLDLADLGQQHARLAALHIQHVAQRGA